jgi:YidC/Oxa1 family membrane protein insertase
MGLRGMANVPVESMRTGGLFWFSDLTVPDQYYLMPLLTSFTMWITIEVGTDSMKLSSGNLQTMKYVLRAMPVCILPFTINFPGVSDHLIERYQSLMARRQFLTSRLLYQI